MNRVDENGYVINFKSNGMSGRVLQYFTRVTSSDLLSPVRCGRLSLSGSFV